MAVTELPLSPPSLETIVTVVEQSLRSNFEYASASVVNCPDLRREPFHLAAEGISGDEKVADVGGQSNLFPAPKFEVRYSLIDIAEEMGLLHSDGMLIGAGAGPFHDIGVNNELAPNLSWKGVADKQGRHVHNLTQYARVSDGGSVLCTQSPTTNCALMMNVYGSKGMPGPVLKVTARKRKGMKNFTDCIRLGLLEHFGADTPISIGGVFLVKEGAAKLHVMPDFPPSDQMPFKSPKQLNDWLTYHVFRAPIVCLTVMHTTDLKDESGKRLGLRMEHTHCFAPGEQDKGGHYHHDIQDEGVEPVEYEAYLNTAKTLYRIDQPETLLERDLHD